MIIYNVTLSVDPAIADEWVIWMKQEHIPDLINTSLFTDAKLCHLLDQDESTGITYVAQYFCGSVDDYKQYIERHADGMRKKVLERYGDKVIAFRTLMETI